MAFHPEDRRFMKRTLLLARRGIGRVSPNPLVGAVIVRHGEVIAEGYHRSFGGDHAEVDAIKRARGDVKGGTLYVNLEPCCHWGKTPPCTDALIKGGIKRVVVGTLDPNPSVNGKGVKILREHGIEVEVGVLEEEARKLNEVYFNYILTGLPFVTIKYAQTLDGRIATSLGESRWISSENSRKLAHRLRAQHDAILVGIGTVLADDPSLTVRWTKGKDPLRIVLDSRLRIPLNAQVLLEEGDTLVVTTDQYDREKFAEIKKKGKEILIAQRDKKGWVELQPLLKTLIKKDVSSILVEGGRKVITSFLKDNLANRMVIITAPLILGEGVAGIGDLGIMELKSAIKPSSYKVSRVGGDMVFDLRL
ncbi:MAG: bifunctional diaminohydroxyphosphoribosylaminopyrimidine deaminase/5-amino-6-(5-phosphoribosylamino)uracil reductase RibD [Deltaproteobacteria bacterium]|nr:MAG: bifunctional diaminohydroxyphosphoribosylaminopyrimidine deaminase/5-amino-6-(5-phosphoribosylamino)uracil reductase RibD [Deltaproteobacteria bacterium]